MSEKKKRVVDIFDDGREAFEDFLADRILSRLDGNEKLDAVKKRAIVAAFDFVAMRTAMGQLISEDMKYGIADEVVKQLAKPNSWLRKQLKKKNKKWIERHRNEVKHDE